MDPDKGPSGVYAGFWGFRVQGLGPYTGPHGAMCFFAYFSIYIYIWTQYYGIFSAQGLGVDYGLRA